MMCKAKGFEIKRKALLLFLSGGLLVLWQIPVLATQSVPLGWEPSMHPNVVGYNIYYGTSSHVYTNKVSVGNVTNTTITALAEGTTYFFAATTYDASDEESAFSNEAAYAVPLTPKNQPPTLNSLGNIAVNENAAARTVALGGITSGAAAEVQTLTVTAVSSDPALIPDPSVTYTSPNKTGSLTFAPAAYASGKALITVTVNDGGPTNNLVKKSFTVFVNAVNQPPTLDPLSNVSLNENDAALTIPLTGISSGAPNENQKLTVTAMSGRTALIGNPLVSYASPDTAGTLTFQPVPKAFGTTTLTVTVNDGGKIVRQTFTVTVNAVNQPPTLKPVGDLAVNENSAAKTITLTGITSGAPNEKQNLTLTAVSSDPSLVPDPIIKYTSPSTVGFLTFKPAADAVGTATITLTVNDGGTSNNVTANTFAIQILRTNAAAVIVAPTNTIGSTGAVVVASDIIAATNAILTATNIAVAADKYTFTVTNNFTGSSSSPTNNLTVDPNPAATLTEAIYENGQYAFYVSGVTGKQYVIQASSNLADWVSVETNTVPFTFVDANASQFSQRFYRAVSQ